MSNIKFLKKLTNDSGVYQMLDEHGNILYVGKAKNLKKRVGSYFRSNLNSYKTVVLMKQVMLEIVSAASGPTSAQLNAGLTATRGEGG